MLRGHSFQIDLKIDHIPNQNHGRVFCRNQLVDFKTYRIWRFKIKRTSIDRNFENQKVGGLIIPDFKTVDISTNLRELDIDLRIN